MAGCGGLSAGVRHPGQPPRTAAAEPSGALPQVPPPSDPSGEVAAAGRHRPHRTSAQPEPSAPMCLRRPVNPSGRRTPRRTRPPQRRRCSWPLCGMGPDTYRRCGTGRGHPLSAARQRTGRVHWQNDQQPCPSSLRQKGRSGCVQAAVMEPVGGHLTAAGRHPAWIPRPPIRQRGRTQDRTPQAADGQSADGFDSLQLPLLSSRPALRAAACGGRPRPADRGDTPDAPAQHRRPTLPWVRCSRRPSPLVRNVPRRPLRVKPPARWRPGLSG
jgi:hypothetical protein